MEHVSYGLFDDTEHARAAIDGIEASGTPRHCCGVVLHKDRLDYGLLGVRETGAPEGAREGAAVGALLGASVGAALMGPMGLVSGGVMGALYGVIGGALAGLSGPDRTLENLSKHLSEGKVLVVVEAPDLASREQADTVMRGNGGRVQHKPFF
jgi:hypothetical protein